MFLGRFIIFISAFLFFYDTANVWAKSMWILISKFNLTFTRSPIQINLIIYQSLYRNEDRFECLYKFTASVSLWSVSLSCDPHCHICLTLKKTVSEILYLDHLPIFFIIWPSVSLRHSMGLSDFPRLGPVAWLIIL